MGQPLYRMLAGLLLSIESGQNDKHNRELIDYILHNFFPSGHGFDNGIRLREDSSSNRLVFEVAYHPMDEIGGYEAWQTTIVTVKPSLVVSFYCKATKGNMKDDIRELTRAEITMTLMRKLEYFVKDINTDGTKNLMVREVKE